MQNSYEQHGTDITMEYINAEGTQGVSVYRRASVFMDVIVCQAEVFDAAPGSVLAISILAFFQNLDGCNRMRQVYSSLSSMNWRNCAYVETVRCETLRERMSSYADVC